MRREKSLITYTMKRNMIILFFVFILILISLGSKIIHIVRVEGKIYNKKVLTQQIYRRVGFNANLPPKRGSILDRNDAVLGKSEKIYNLIFDPGVLASLSKETQEKSIQYVVEHFGYEEEKLKGLIEERFFSYYEKIILGLKYSDIEDEYKTISSGEIKGIWLEGIYDRIYPNEHMLGDVLGFTNANNEGTWGIEEYYDEYLQGQWGRKFGIISDGNYVEQQYIEPKKGNTIVLTIDETIQYFTENAIRNFLKEHKAKNITVISMNPQNGEILSLASYPNFDLNNPSDLTTHFSQDEIEDMTLNDKNIFRNNLWRNSAISDTYEPGSTYKAFVLAAALEENHINYLDRFLCDGGKQIYDKYITCWKKTGHGEQSLDEALANSCNIAFMEIAEKMGRDDYYKYQGLFGFSSETGIDLLGEASGILHTKEQLNPVELATASFGQGFTITALQLITSFSSLINGGYMYEPHIMKKIINEDNQIIKINEKRLIRQVISRNTAENVKKSLHEVVIEGTGKKASIEGYETGGKTGTAEKLPRGSGVYVVSYIGFAPIDNPRIITLVVVDEPIVEKISSLYATKIFVDAMENILPYLKVQSTR